MSSRNRVGDTAECGIPADCAYNNPSFVDVRHVLTVLAVVAAMALPKLSWSSMTRDDRQTAPMLVMVGHLRPRRKFPASGPNRAGTAGQRNDEQAVLDAIRRISRIARAAGHDVRRGGITPAQVIVLRALDNPVALSLNELASRTMTSASSASEAVGRLVALGLVRRTRSPADGRSVELSLTDCGRAGIANATGADDGLRAGIARMGFREKRQLSRLLGRLLGKLDPAPAVRSGDPPNDVV